MISPVRSERSHLLVGMCRIITFSLWAHIDIHVLIWSLRQCSHVRKYCCYRSYFRDASIPNPNCCAVISISYYFELFDHLMCAWWILALIHNINQVQRNRCSGEILGCSFILVLPCHYDLPKLGVSWNNMLMRIMVRNVMTESWQVIARHYTTCQDLLNLA